MKKAVRNALQAHCSREPAAANWACPVVELRRYVRLENQDFEVRVKGDVEASMLVPCDGGYFVSWTDRNHQSGVLVKARLAAAGSPEERDDWEASLHEAD